MRKLLLATAVASLLAPMFASADPPPRTRRAPRPPRASSGYVVSEPSRALTTTAGPGRVVPYQPAPRATYGSNVYLLGVDAVPFWLGWSWGWGYYPLWPRPYYEGAGPGYRPEDAYRVTARLDAYGAAATNTAAGTLAMSVEGSVGGFSADVTGISFRSPPGTVGGATTLTLGGARATWSIASEAALRLRLELGASMLSIPDTGVYTGASYANTMVFGPQVGVSGHLGLIGPFGLEGHARLTPIPFPIVDTRAAVVVRGGPLAVSAGWRAIDVNGNRIDNPSAHFEGPELGLSLVF